MFKKLTIILLFLLFSSNSFARIDNLFYLAESRDLFGGLDLTYKLGDSASRRLDKSLRPYFLFGVNKRLNVRSSISYIEGDIDGFSNPEFNITYRLVKENEQSFIADIEVLYSPNLIKTKSSNIADGDNNFDIRFVLGRDLDTFAFKIYTESQYFTESYQINRNREIIKDDSRINWEFGIAIQPLITQYFSATLYSKNLISSTYTDQNDNLSKGGDIFSSGLSLKFSQNFEKYFIDLSYDYKNINSSILRGQFISAKSIHNITLGILTKF